MPLPIVVVAGKLLGSYVLRKGVGKMALKYGADELAGNLLRRKGMPKTARVADVVSRRVLDTPKKKK